MTYRTDTLAETLRHLRSGPFVGSGVRRMARALDDVTAEFYEAVVADVPAFSNSRNPEILPDLARHAGEIAAEMLRLMEGGELEPFDFVREFARKRADQRFPLEATLHVYRCGHKVLARWLRNAMLDEGLNPADARAAVALAADFTTEFTDEVTTVAAGTYVSQTRILTEVAGDRRAQLLAMLLEGYDESDIRVTEVLRSAGYLATRRSYCVAVARSVDPAEMLHSARARRMVNSIDRILQDAGFQCLVDLRNNVVTIVCSDVCRTSGWSTHQVDLAGRLTSALALVGTAAIIGVSNDALATSQIPTAYRQAELALEFADVSRRVMQYSQISFQHLLLHVAGEELQRLMPFWADRFRAADGKARGALTATLAVYAESDMNVIKSANILKVHPNTVYARFEKIFDITGLRPQSFHDLNELLLVANCHP